MKEKFKKFFNWCSRHEFISITIFSIAFAFIVHILFYFPAPFPFLDADWDSGDVLTYVSTIFLGALALWQNKRFKEANDKHEEEMRIANEEAQRNLTQLLSDANNISIKSKIVDIESKKIENVSSNIKEFDKACFFPKIYTILQEYISSKINQDDIYKMKQDAFEKLIELIQSLENDSSGNFKEVSKEATQYYKSLKCILDFIYNIDTTCDNLIDGSADYEKELSKFSILLEDLSNCRINFNAVSSECINTMNIKYSKLLNSLNETVR